jgi:hypothetical protein
MFEGALHCWPPGKPCCYEEPVSGASGNSKHQPQMLGGGCATKHMSGGPGAQQQQERMTQGPRAPAAAANAGQDVRVWQVVHVDGLAECCGLTPGGKGTGSTGTDRLDVAVES